MLHIMHYSIDTGHIETVETEPDNELWRINRSLHNLAADKGTDEVYWMEHQNVGEPWVPIEDHQHHDVWLTQFC